MQQLLEQAIDSLHCQYVCRSWHGSMATSYQVKKVALPAMLLRIAQAMAHTHVEAIT